MRNSRVDGDGSGAGIPSSSTTTTTTSMSPQRRRQRSERQQQHDNHHPRQVTTIEIPATPTAANRRRNTTSIVMTTATPSPKLNHDSMCNFTDAMLMPSAAGAAAAVAASSSLGSNPTDFLPSLIMGHRRRSLVTTTTTTNGPSLQNPATQDGDSNNTDADEVRIESLTPSNSNNNANDKNFTNDDSLTFPSLMGSLTSCEWDDNTSYLFSSQRRRISVPEGPVPEPPKSTSPNAWSPISSKRHMHRSPSHHAALSLTPTPSFDDEEKRLDHLVQKSMESPPRKLSQQQQQQQQQLLQTSQLNNSITIEEDNTATTTRNSPHQHHHRSASFIQNAVIRALSGTSSPVSPTTTITNNNNNNNNDSNHNSNNNNNNNSTTTTIVFSSSPKKEKSRISLMPLRDSDDSGGNGSIRNSKDSNHRRDRRRNRRHHHNQMNDDDDLEVASVASRGSGSVLSHVSVFSEAAQSGHKIIIRTRPYKVKEHYIESIFYVSVSAIIGAVVRTYVARIFGNDCEDYNYIPQDVIHDFLTPLTRNICVTNSGRTIQTGGALFYDFPANVLGSFIMGIITPPLNQPRARFPWLHRDHALQRDDVFHASLATGFCGCLTTFASWNSQMVVMLDGTYCELGSQVVTVLFGYGVGLLGAVGGFQFGRNVGLWWYDWKHRNESPVELKTSESDTSLEIGDRPIERRGSTHQPIELVHDVVSEDGDTPDPNYWHKIPLFLTAVGLLVAFVVGDLKADIQWYKGMAMLWIFAPAGSLLRWKLSTLNTRSEKRMCPKLPRWVPWGTFTANLSAAIISASLAGIIDRYFEGSTNARLNNAWLEAILFALSTGFAGSLSTVSTMVKEAVLLSEQHEGSGKSHVYQLGTCLCSMFAGLMVYATIVRV